MNPTRQHTGSCLCGGVRYLITGQLRPVVACHCHQCRKTSGHFVAATQCTATDIQITGDTLRWYRSSECAERGFCARCGSNLFWREFGSDCISVWAGTIDGKTGLKMEAQIHTESKGDYYDLPDCQTIAQKALK